MSPHPRSAFDLVPHDRPADLARLYQDLLTRGELAAYEVSQRFYEIGSFAGLEEIRRYLAAHLDEILKAFLPSPRT